jgi:UDP-N-acetylglucosamine 3-dehydrogenase
MSSNRYRYAIIGTGRPHGTEGSTGFGMAHTHWPAFRAIDKVDLVAIADVRDDPAQFFLAKYASDAKHYTDYKEMLAQERPDIVSICVWPHLHAEIAIAAAEAGVKVIHCEKPMATTWGDCKRMKAAADAHGALLSFNHQRRHLKLFQAVRQAVRDGEIGELVMVEAQVGDMFDWGTHWLDMMFFYNEETPAEWVIGQIDSRQEKRAFGAYEEEQAICHFKWKNGVRGVLIAGYEASIHATHRLIGTEGVLEVLSERSMRLLSKGEAGWRVVEVPQGDRNEHVLTALDVVRQLDEPGHRSFLNIDNAIQHTEVIYATYESSRHRGRIDLPLVPEDSALLAMLAAGQIGPERRT